MAVALDSSVIVAFLDRGDALHDAADARIRHLLEEGTHFHSSAVTYSELLVGAKLGHHDDAVVRGFFRDLVARIEPLDAQAAETAAELLATSGLRTPDALIVAAADGDRDVDLLLTGDEQVASAAELIRCRIEVIKG